MSYPSWWNKDITLYNRFEYTIGQISWYRHNLSGCFTKNTESTKLSGNGIVLSSSFVVRIRKSDDFRKPFDWVQSNDKANLFTLQTGDIIVFGAVTDNVNEHSAGQRPTDIVSKYKSLGCFRINFVNINDTGDLKHYLVKG